MAKTKILDFITWGPIVRDYWVNYSAKKSNEAAARAQKKIADPLNEKIKEAMGSASMARCGKAVLTVKQTLSPAEGRVTFTNGTSMLRSEAEANGIRCGLMRGNDFVPLDQIHSITADREAVYAVIVEGDVE